ncbi:chondroitin sulfate proteoglycan 4 [Coregonus clupeaformis]|uniref:chondroitin sulfate proteoglycan 4 n=1 Tax=Coregonus clupeaformis TaxID=59861 RepID=UPI001E1C8C3D|nr:chondroitin sulfate proteoglycan 4 [Coregonus clupeaformis]
MENMEFPIRSTKKLCFCAALLWSLVSDLALGASFYGDGYVQLKAVESSNRNSLRVGFRTSSPHGLLFLAAGHTDYLLVELNAGRLQVKLDLGSGERLLRSETSTQLNDLAWHTVELLHDRHNVTLTVDQHSLTSLRMPGHGSQKQELTIQDGLYVGGSGGLDKLYLPNDLTGFRGCMDKAVFNENDMLSSLRPYAGFKSVYEVSLGCSPQFFAGEEDPVSFFSSRAYVSLPPWNISHNQQEALFECVVHTSAKEGIVLYNSARQGDFVAVEIQEGLLVAIVGKGGTKTELKSLTFVNDRNWHSVKLFFTPKTLQLTVDEETVKTSISSRSKGLQLRGSLFVGGIDDSTRSEVRKMGLVSVLGKRVRGGSFKGCLKDMKVNGVMMGLPNAVVTKDISVGCEPEKEPEPSTTMGPTTIPTVPKSWFDPTSVTPTPEFPMFTLARGLDKRYGDNFVLLRNLVIPEGGRGSLESKHIKVLLDFKKLGVRQSQIMFRIQEQPVHGQIRLDVDQDQEENIFSMLDLWHGRVMYIHGGSEDPEDFFTFSIFSSSRKEVPTYLKGTRRYRYNITVTPTNDAPELSLPQGNLFVLLENSRKLLTKEVLKATDIDSNHTDLVFSILGNLNADAGYLEVADNPDTAVTTFSHSDLEEGKVNYVHTGVRNSRIVLRVSDGDKVSNTVVLRIMAVGLEYKIANNTGLEITQGEVAVISNKQLAIQTNAVKQVVDIRYDVVEPPQYGELQRLHSSGEWKPTGSFSQRLLEKERLRYISTFQEIQIANATDYFKCKVTVAGRVNTELVFPVTVKWVHYNLVRNIMADIDKVRKVTLGSQYLYATVDFVTLSEDDLHFRVLSSPKKGKLLLVNELLNKNSTFSQRNVTDLKVQYELVDRPYEDTSDTFQFQVFSKHAQSQSYDFQISIKADVNSVFIRNDKLSIMEGESKLITKDELFAETLSTKEMFYTVTSSPKHGKLARINLSNSNTSYNNIRTFSNKDLLEERVVYIHDDTETTQDQFTFIASTSLEFKSSVTDDEVGSKEGTFNISIQLVNDEKPVRVVDKVFHVVRDGQRLLTLDDLCYHDADSDFSDGQLVYTRRGIPMGDLVLVNDTSHRLFQFTQKELEEKRVLFLHRGVSSGRFVLFVSDGKHLVSTLLEVNAHDPFLRLGNNTGLLVQKGKEVTVTTGNFSILTNLNVRDDSEVTYEVSEPPRNGWLYRHGNISMELFTQHDLKKGLVSYRHDDSKNLADWFSVTVKVKGHVLNARINVKVYLESHQRPPILQHNNTLLVEESKPVKIDESRLEVTHEDNLPSEIVFTVKVAPLHGFLRCFVEAEEQYVGTEQTPVQTFSQEDVNAGNVQYMQTAPGQVNDTFLLDVSNGVTEVNSIRMSVDIIPRLIPLQVSNFTLREGGSKALTQEVLRVTNRHFSGLNFQYILTEPPQNGYIEHSRNPGAPVLSFTRRQVEQELIYYIHDSSETLEDNFTVVANDTGLRKQSSPCTAYIQVTAVNDQPPVITANRVLRVWVGSVTEILPEDLNAQDEDTPPEELQVIVTPPSNGHLALKSAPSRPLLNFTLKHIHLGQLLFVHSGAMSGGFNFQVNDGVNFAPRQIFSITASALVLSLEINRPLKVFPGSTTPITKEDLQAVTNDKSDTSNRTITFNVIRRPKLGRLVTVLADNITVDVSSFTQTMVDQREILYIQSLVASVGWSAMDSMTFSVSSPPAALENETFKMDISYENAGPDRKTLLLANTGAVVTEGDSIVIDKSKLDASNLMSKLPTPQRSSHEIWFQVKSLPQHGVVVVGERNLTVEKPNFSQYILNKYGITYRHDDSETLHDRFLFVTWLNPKGKPAQRPLDDNQVLEEWFNITVIPVNDQPPVLKTKAPSLSVVQGDTVALGPENLNVEDLDNPSEDIQYTVISKPNNGYLALGGSLNESVVSFTQAQINSGKVYFVHDGSHASGVFYFSVSDGHHKPVYKLFNLEVTEITISLVNNTGLSLEQGQTSAVLTHGSLVAETNGKNTTVHYRITAAPRYGKILWLDDQEVSQFEQEDLRTGSLFYHMTTLTSGQDSFEFTAFTSEANLTNQVFNITVKPLVRFGKGVRIPNGIVVKLNTGFLNATELASLSVSDPFFEVVSHPKYGKLVRGKPKAGKKTEPLESFFFQDVKQERLSFELNANMTGVQELNDSLVFILKAENVPPARGEFRFTVVPYDPSLVRTTESPILTTSSPFSQPLNQTNQTTMFGVGTALPSLSTSLLSTQRPSKTHQKFKGRNRWGNTNRNDSVGTGTTLGKPTLSKGDDNEIPFVNTPVRVESYPQKTSNPILVVLPLLALLLLVIILVVLVLLLRRNRKRKQKPLTPKPPPSPSPSTPPAYNGKSQRSVAVPTVTVTPLSPSSPALDRLLPSANQGLVSNSASLPLCSWHGVDPESSAQIIRTTPPTLQQNQYWV